MAIGQRTSPVGKTMQPLLTPDEVAKLLGLSTKTLAEWRSKGRGPDFVRLRRNIRYRLADIKAYLAENIVRGNKAAELSSRRDSAGDKGSSGKKRGDERAGKANLGEALRKKKKKKSKRAKT